MKNIYCSECRFWGQWSIPFDDVPCYHEECYHPTNWTENHLVQRWTRMWSPRLMNANNDCRLYLPTRTNKNWQRTRILIRRVKRCLNSS